MVWDDRLIPGAYAARRASTIRIREHPPDEPHDEGKGHGLNDDVSFREVSIQSIRNRHSYFRPYGGMGEGSNILHGIDGIPVQQAEARTFNHSNLVDASVFTDDERNLYLAAPAHLSRHMGIGDAAGYPVPNIDKMLLKIGRPGCFRGWGCSGIV